MSALSNWLDQQGLGGLGDLLAENDVDLEILSSLTESDLTEIGLSVGNQMVVVNEDLVGRPRRVVAPSTTSSCMSVAV